MPSLWILSLLIFFRVSKTGANIVTTSAVNKGELDQIIPLKCADGSIVDDECECDEMKTLCQEQSCLKKGEKVQRRNMCDGVFDCSDLSDECLCDRRTRENSNTYDICRELLSNTTGQCPTGYIACGKQSPSGAKLDCVESNEICDETSQCKSDSGLDEKFCRYTQNGSFTGKNGVFHPKVITYYFCENMTTMDMELDWEGLVRGYQDGKWIYIDWRRRFDGIADCTDISDEWHPNLVYCGTAGTNLTITRCPDGKRVLATPETLVDTMIFPVMEWILGIVAFVGNTMVATHSLSAIFRHYRGRNRYQNDDDHHSSNATLRTITGGGKIRNYVLVLFLCTGDLLMAIQILLMAGVNEHFRGYYWEHDEVWQSSSLCTVIGSLAIFSTQASAFMIVVISFVRLHVVSRPFKKLKLKYVIGASISTYVLAAILMLIPSMTFVKPFEEYFIHSAYIPNPIQSDATVLERDKAMEYVQNILLLDSPDNSMDVSNLKLSDMESKVREINPDFANWSYFGYYSQISICIPPIVAHWSDPGLIYSFILLVIDFTGFLMVFCAYYVVFRKTRRGNTRCNCFMAVGCCANPRTRRSTIDLSDSNNGNPPIPHIRQRARSLTRDEEDYEMQKRILWIIGTDFACWSPICILTLVSMIDPSIKSPDSVLIAMMLVQINCVVNPIVYSRRIRSGLKHGIKKCFKFIRNFIRTHCTSNSSGEAEFTSGDRTSETPLPHITLVTVTTSDKATSTSNLTTSADSITEFTSVSQL